MSTLRVANLQSTAGTQTVTQDRLYRGAATAWVNFNGSGTVAIRDSYNVSSITDNGVGDYTVNFTTALANANYSAVFGVMNDNAIGSHSNFQACLRTAQYPATGTVRVYAGVPSSGVVADSPMVNVTIFGGY